MTDEKKLKPLNEKHLRVLDEYLLCWKKVKAYQAVYPDASYESAKSAAVRLFTNDNFSAHLQVRLDELHMGTDEALARTAEIGRTGVGFFFKVSDEWMFNPLPEYEILAEQEMEREKEDGAKEKVICYRVRHAVLDMDKVMDERYSHLIKKFANSRKSGVSIETYSAQEAHRDVLKVHGKIKPDNFELVIRYANPNDKPTPTP